MTALKALMLGMLGYDQPHPMISAAQNAQRRFGEAKRGAEATTDEPERVAFCIATGNTEPARRHKKQGGPMG